MRINSWVQAAARLLLSCSLLLILPSAAFATHLATPSPIQTSPTAALPSGDDFSDAAFAAADQPELGDFRAGAVTFIWVCFLVANILLFLIYLIIIFDGG